MLKADHLRYISVIFHKNKPMETASVSVLYLCWLPYGVDCFQDFVDSYKKFDAGIDHDLVIVFKGWTQPDDTLPFIRILQAGNIKFHQLSYTGDNLDVSTYYWAAQQLHAEYILFLNTRSRILAVNWLRHFYELSRNIPTSVFCATGSWQSYASSVFTIHKFTYERNKSVKQNFDKYKLFMKAATLWWYYFPLFPNPHIRTNAFFINRELFLSLQIGKVFTKIDAYRFESGRNSFTNQLRRKGYQVALLSKDGKMFTEKEWPVSNIFWQGFQENLLISDNQTEAYFHSDIENKKLLKRLAWG